MWQETALQGTSSNQAVSLADTLNLNIALLSSAGYNFQVTLFEGVEEVIWVYFPDMTHFIM